MPGFPQNSVNIRFFPVLLLKAVTFLQTLTALTFVKYEFLNGICFGVLAKTGDYRSNNFCRSGFSFVAAWPR